MIFKKNRTFHLIVLLWCCSLVLPSQEVVIREKTSGNPISFESHYIRQDSSNSIIIPFRIRYDFFVFTRPMSNPSSPFQANGEISIEMIDSTGTSVARNIQEITLSTEDNSSSTLQSEYLQQLFTFRLPSGKYGIVVRVEDRESQRVFSDHKRFVTIPYGGNILSDLIPFSEFNDNHFTLFNLGGDVLFSHNYGFVFLSSFNISSVRYSLYKLTVDDDEKEPLIVGQSADVMTIDQSTLIAEEKNQSILLGSAKGGNNNVQYIQFNGLQLRQGRYELEMTFPDSTKHSVVFGAQWLDMPLSLTDLNTAIDPLQYITTKDEYSDLRSGSRTTRINNFDEFWKKRDRTPETAYNEVMHEFYRRVDYTYKAFRTLKGSNGSLTDRGKIYILYGKPTSTERLLSPEGAPKEIWKYNSLNKIFTFEDPSKQGNYKLAENK